MNKFDN